MAIRNWTPKRVPDLTGKTYVITGANSGIGFEAAKILASRGAAITLACRNRQKAETAMAAIRKALGDNTPLSLVEMDLGNLASIRAGASEILETTPQIDGLINNAGLMTPPRRQMTQDHFEVQFGVNHLGHFLLSGLLKDRVLSAGGRFVCVSSLMHKAGARAIRFKDPHWERGYRPVDAYAQSKLANAMFGVELNRRLEAGGHASRAVICHPGYSATNLQSAAPGGLFKAIMVPGNILIAQSAERGAWPTVLAATDEEAEGGRYYGPTFFGELRGPVGTCRMIRAAKDKDASAQLWSLSEEAVGLEWTV